ncbi:PLDc N-terminal domain-containing protein [Geodermatophilus marinus]|uniref:PLDc N-terminal domain-containing protein n=1 Tax=Geodermatophilus sp. LHW52908 TaxID=2303986 RepID=UPI000E3C1982|nr:PLDc N-terminal domain-containing protein [Geodermatophilus sp. LHW52908]RFU20449.1 hypothetical protein D0Z06_16380 [Geodermatophilus sp. LHW52908]
MTGRTRRRWADLSGRQRAALAALAAVQLALAVGAWTDLARRRPDEVDGSRGLWAVVIAVNWVGPLAWFRWGRRR